MQFKFQNVTFLHYKSYSQVNLYLIFYIVIHNLQINNHLPKLVSTHTLDNDFIYAKLTFASMTLPNDMQAIDLYCQFEKKTTLFWYIYTMRIDFGFGKEKLRLIKMHRHHCILHIFHIRHLLAALAHCLCHQLIGWKEDVVRTVSWFQHIRQREREREWKSDWGEDMMWWLGRFGANRIAHIFAIVIDT